MEGSAEKMAVPLALCLKPHNPVSPSMTPVCSVALPPLEPRGNTCECSIVCGCFGRVLGFLAASGLSWQMDSPLIFIDRWYMGFSSRLVFLAWSLEWSWVLTSSGGSFAAEISLCIPNHTTCQRRASHFHICILPAGLHVVLLCVLSYRSSIRLVFRWLFRLTVLQFSCNSSLVLGRGECDFHLLCCHLGSPIVFYNHLYFCGICNNFFSFISDFIWLISFFPQWL